jgi:hypothetical protein
MELVARIVQYVCINTFDELNVSFDPGHLESMKPTHGPLHSLIQNSLTTRER